MGKLRILFFLILGTILISCLVLTAFSNQKNKEISIAKSETLPDIAPPERVKQVLKKVGNATAIQDNFCSKSKNKWGAIVNCEIKISQDIYNLKTDIEKPDIIGKVDDSSSKIGKNRYVLFKNGKQIWSKDLIFGAEEPVTDIFVHSNSSVLSYVLRDGKNTTNDVVINGESMRYKYNLESAYSPMIIKDKLTFLGESKNKVSIVIDGELKNLNYETIFHNGCCSVAGQNPTGDDKSVYFYAKRHGEWFWVTEDI